MLDLQPLATACVPGPIPASTQCKIAWELGSCVLGRDYWALLSKTRFVIECLQTGETTPQNHCLLRQQTMATFYGSSGFLSILRCICSITLRHCSCSKTPPHSAHTSTNLRHFTPVLWLDFHECRNPIFTMQHPQNFFFVWKSLVPLSFVDFSRMRLLYVI